MKEFNLDAALNGEPVNASGQKCYVVREVTELLDDQSCRRFVVIFPDGSTVAEIWYEHDFVDDIAMWEEPKKQISIEDLPKPFKPKDGESYFYITGGIVEYEDDYLDSNKFDKSSAERGGCFRTRGDAQKWLDFMKSMME